jgi:hypothetical protein
MRPCKFAPFVLASALAIGACTPMQWSHPGFDQPGAQRELAGCRQQAWIETQQRAFAYGFDPWWPYGPRRRYPGYYGPSFVEQQMLENQLADFCMRSKGFVLVPVT